MNIDYNKVIKFLCKEEVSILNEVLITIVNAHFIMDSVKDNKIVLLDRTTNDKYYMEYTDRLLIYRDNYNELCLCDNFGYLFEITFDNNIINVSNIINVNSPDGIVSSNIKLEYNNGYNVVNSRYVLLGENDLDTLSNKESIKGFVDSFKSKRTNVFNDLFWDLDLLRKSMGVDALVNKKVNINSKNFNEIYKELLTIIINTMNNIANN